MELKKEWFEPGPDGVSPFDDYYLNFSGGTGGSAISAAFHALLAGPDCGHTVDAKDAEIAELRESLERTKLALNTTRQQRDNFWSQRDAARAELARLKNECSDQQSYVLDLESAIARKDTRIKVLEVANDSLTQYSSNLTTKRDALQEKIEAWQDATGLVGIYSDGSEGNPGDVTPEMLSKHLDELRSKASELDKVLAVLMEAHVDPDVASMAQIGIPSQVANWITVCQKLRTRYDALQARIDAGVRAWEKWKQQCGSLWLLAFPGVTASQEWSDVCDALDADYVVYPIAEADERTAGTIADRGKAS